MPRSLRRQSPPQAAAQFPPALVEIENVTLVGSRRSQPGDAFEIRLAEPIIVDGRTIVPAGATGIGEVVHAARATGGGNGGELILAAPHLEVNGVRIALRGMRFSGTGEDGQMSFVTGPGYAAVTRGRGRNIEVPAGTRHKATVATAVFVSAD